jgi:hypothetical protein
LNINRTTFLAQLRFAFLAVPATGDALNISAQYSRSDGTAAKPFPLFVIP